jgi:hypothetical protein
LEENGSANNQRAATRGHSVNNTDTFVRVFEALRKRGLKVSVGGVPFIAIEDHPFAYAPDGQGSWRHMHHDEKAWTHLISHDDPEVIADAIHKHFAAKREIFD